MACFVSYVVFIAFTFSSDDVLQFRPLFTGFHPPRSSSDPRAVNVEFVPSMVLRLSDFFGFSLSSVISPVLHGYMWTA